MTFLGQEMSSIDYDTIIVGAGISGLYAAYTLIQQNGYRVLVLEADSEVGGRTKTVHFEDGSYADVGGMWLAKTQTRMIGLAEELGVELMLQYDEGKAVMIDATGKRSEYTGTIPSLGVLSLVDLHFCIRQVDSLAKQVPIDDPSKCPKAAEWDAISVEFWKQRQAWSIGAKESIDIAIRLVFGQEPCEISFLYFLWYVNCSGGIMSLIDVKNGAQEIRMVGGAQSISHALFKRIEEKGGKIVVNSPVNAIEHDASKICVKTESSTYTALSIIVACPPRKASHIRFFPPLPLDKQTYLERAYTGCYTKCILFYQVAFWREEGYSGSVTYCGDDENLPVNGLFDYTDKDGKFPAVAAFITGDPAKLFATKNDDEQIEVLKKSMVQMLGEKGKNFQRCIIKEWSKDKWTGGCPVSVLPAGSCRRYGIIPAKAVGDRIFWAGTEAATKWCGYMEGAVDSAERASQQVVNLLEKIKH